MPLKQPRPSSVRDGPRTRCGASIERVGIGRHGCDFVLPVARVLLPSIGKKGRAPRSKTAAFTTPQFFGISHHPHEARLSVSGGVHFSGWDTHQSKGKSSHRPF